MKLNFMKGDYANMQQLETKRYLLRKPTEEDAEEIYEKWGTDKENMAQYKEHKLYRNVIEAKVLINAASQEDEDGILYLIIEDKKTKEIIGYIKLPAGIIKDKKRELAFYFLEGHREDGTPEEVLTAVINYIFSKEEYETIITKFYDRSEKDTKLTNDVLTRVGMKKDGILRNRLINDEGKKIDKHIYSILKEEWEANRKNN